MGTPTFNSADITVITSAESTTNWSQSGQMGPNLETDIKTQGSGAVGIEFKSVAASSLRYDRLSGSTIVGMHIRVWVFLIDAGTINTFANQGLTLRVWGTNGTDWGEWDLAGSDTGAWVGQGWKMIVQDCDKAFDRNSGTAPAKTAIQYIGFGVDVIGTLSKTSGFVVDRMMISASADTSDTTGGVLEITGGTAGAPVSLQDIVTKDQVTDDSWFGHITKDKNGSYEFTGKLVLGDAAGALNTVIRDTKRVMIWADNPVGTSQYQMAIVEDTGTTEVSFGTEVGTGDDSRGVDGGFMNKFEDVFTFDYKIVSDVSGPTFNIFGAAIEGAAAGLSLTQTGVQFVSVGVTSCGQIVLSGGAEMREGFIIGSTEPSGVGAILLNANPTDPEFRDMQLINNIHAIESETNGPTTLDLRNIQFSGNTADIRFNHSSGLLTVNVLEGGDTPTTSDGGFGGTISVVSAVAVSFEAVDKDNVAISGCQVSAYLTSDDSQIILQDTNVSGIASTTFNGVTPADIYYRYRKSSPGDTKYENLSGFGTIASGSGLTVKRSMTVDTNNNA